MLYDWSMVSNYITGKHNSSFSCGTFCEAKYEIRLLKVILFGSIEMEVITTLTAILPKLYLYDKWKNNKRKYKEITQ
jgi:hypothetical protein